MALCALLATCLSAQTFTTLYSFCSQAGCPDGQFPYASLVQGIDGNLWGTTQQGGAHGSGTIYKITPDGQLTTLYNFCSQRKCWDGSYPYSGLTLANNGSLYGTTQIGGVGAGTVFLITASGGFTSLHKFQVADGYSPTGGLVQANNGSLYGTTQQGGGYNEGEFFNITPGGALTPLYSFCSQSGCPEYPDATLVQDANGDFWGTTYYGGAYGAGAVFQVTARGAPTTVYSFCAQAGCVDGEYPAGGVIEAAAGDFYGTTQAGGAYGFGTVFKLTAQGNLTTLYSFCPTMSGCLDGSSPRAGLIQATDGNFYGSTTGGGIIEHGTIFRITASGALTTLYMFCAQSGCTDGSYPYAGLVQATDGRFYGTTTGYGTTGGPPTIYRLSVGLAPFIKTQPTSGKAESAVTILGTALAGATSVTFNGVAAEFTVVSDDEITTAVPMGAATGRVRVVTPKGTLSSNTVFRVRP